MREFTLSVRGRKAFSGVLELQAPAVQYYMHKEDRDVFGGIRSCAPCPAVFVLKNDSHVFLSRQWQYYIRAINYNMPLKDVYLLLDDHLAFANNTGFPSLENPGTRIDYFFNRNINNVNAKPPQLDKVRTCSRNILTGTEQYSVTQSLWDVVELGKRVGGRSMGFLDARKAFRAATSTNANLLKVWLFDSTKPPPLKPGKSYPSDISRVNPDDYLYMPQTDPEKFLVANIVNRAGEVVQFPRGALYPWFEGGKTVGSFMPHIYNPVYGEVLYPMRNLVKVASVPSPYRNS